MGLRQMLEATYKQAGTGIRVNRAAALDIAAATTLFTVTGGLVLCTGFYGVVTGLRSAGAGATMSLTFVGVATTALHNPAAAITGNATVGTVFTLTGDPADPLIVGVGQAVANTVIPLQGGLNGSLAGGIMQFGLILGVGVIQVANSAIAGVGATRWILTYIPLDDGAAVN